MDWNNAYETDLLPSGDISGWVAAPAKAFTLSSEDYGEIANGRQTFVIHGAGRYEDLTGRRYLIEPFAFRFDPSSGFISWSSFIIHYPDNWPGAIDDDEDRIEELTVQRDEQRRETSQESLSSTNSQNEGKVQVKTLVCARQLDKS